MRRAAEIIMYIGVFWAVVVAFAIVVSEPSATSHAIQLFIIPLTAAGVAAHIHKSTKENT